MKPYRLRAGVQPFGARPPLVDAVQFTGTPQHRQILDDVRAGVGDGEPPTPARGNTRMTVSVPFGSGQSTLELAAGDYLLRGHGRWIPYPRDVFEALYEPV